MMRVWTIRQVGREDDGSPQLIADGPDLGPGDQHDDWPAIEVAALDLEPEFELSERQVVRLRRIIGTGLDPSARDLSIQFLEGNRIRLRSKDTRQEWTIGPRGGSS